MIMGSQVTTGPRLEQLPQQRFFVELDDDKRAITPEAALILDGLIARRENWTRQAELTEIEELQGLTVHERREVVERAAREIALITFSEQEISLLMVDDEGEGPEYRLHRDVQSIDLTIEAPQPSREVANGVSQQKPKSTERNGSKSRTYDGYSGQSVRPETGRTGSRRAEDDDLIRYYLREIGRFPLLKAADEVALAQAIERANTAEGEIAVATQQGTPIPAARRRELDALVKAGKAAETLFINANLRLVVSIAKRYKGSDLSMLDHIQNGNIGLMKAVEKFDWRKGFKFSTYATWWIKQSITREMANTGRLIRLPVHASDNMSRLYRTNNQLQLELRRAPMIEELAQRMDLTEKQIIDLMSWDEPQVSLDSHMGDDSEKTYADVISDPSVMSVETEAINTAIVPKEVRKILEALDEREQVIVIMRHGLDSKGTRTLQEIGNHFDLTRERIRQIEGRAMSKLRHPAVAGSKLSGMLGDA